METNAIHDSQDIGEELYTGERGLVARTYEDTDWPMVAGWFKVHRSAQSYAGKLREVTPEGLPPVGIVIEKHGEPVGALWVYFSVNVGVAFLEAPVTKPGLSRQDASDIMLFALGAIEKICRTHDYGLLIGNAIKPVAFWLERNAGFEKGPETVQMWKLIN